ncbi:unnamed protein product [Oppiella nova]|uniref:Transferrin-like domain-containing protein n=1 Tax=Oppiella nova TaxID=334625 RepID=A0A7R9L823_9ACAR|nr:unnamed protein product [Oppiella nova]CAG2158032.1 unnamed protein product [Oppiella nova]
MHVLNPLCIGRTINDVIQTVVNQMDVKPVISQTRYGYKEDNVRSGAKPRLIFCAISGEEQSKCEHWSQAIQRSGWNAFEYDLECKVATDKDQCMNWIENSLAHLVVLDPGEVFTGGRYHSLVPIMFELYNAVKEKGYYSVAVVKTQTSSFIRDIRDLRGRKACFTGVGHMSGWVIPISRLLDEELLDIRDCNNMIRSAANFFGDSCAPNSLIDKNNPIGNNPLSMCALCSAAHPDKTKCSGSDVFANFEGAFQCLSTVGDVAFLKHTTISQMSRFKHINKNEYELLCPTGGRRPVDAYQECNWGFVPSHAVVISSATLPEERNRIQKFLFESVDRFSPQKPNRDYLSGQTLRPGINRFNQSFSSKTNLTKYSLMQFDDKLRTDDQFSLFGDSLKYGAMNLLFADETTAFGSVDISKQTFAGYLRSYELPPRVRFDYRSNVTNMLDYFEKLRKCPVPNARFCVVSDKELEKCQRMKTAFHAQMLKPELSCLKGHSTVGCMALIRDGNADLTVLDAGDIYTGGHKFNLEPIVSEQNNLNDTYYYVVAITRQSDKNTDLLYLKGKKSCHTGFGLAAGWVVPLSFLLSNSRMRPYGCDSVRAASEFFQKSCIPGALSREYYSLDSTWDYGNLCDLCHGASYRFCSRDSSEPFFGDTGALRCLVEGGGEIAFAKHTTILENTGGRNPDWWARNVIPDDFELLCRDGTRATYRDFKRCHLGRVATNAIVTNKYNDNYQKEAFINLFIYAQQFYGSKYSEDFTFKMFVSQSDYHDLIFQDSTVQLKAIPYNKRDYRQYLGHDFLKAMTLVDCTATAHHTLPSPINCVLVIEDSVLKSLQKESISWSRSERSLLALSVYSGDGTIILLNEDGLQPIEISQKESDLIPLKSGVKIACFQWNPVFLSLVISWESGELGVYSIKNSRAKWSETSVKAYNRQKTVVCMEWMNDGLSLFTVDMSGKIVIWEYDEKANLLLEKFTQQISDQISDTLAVTFNKVSFVYFGSNSGTVFQMNESTGTVNDIVALESGIKRLLHYSKRSRLIIITESMLLCQYSLSTTSSDICEVSKVKLSTSARNMASDIITAQMIDDSIGLIAICFSGERVVRLWQLESGNNAAVIVAESAESHWAGVTSVSYWGNLMVAGTSNNHVIIWKRSSGLEFNRVSQIQVKGSVKQLSVAKSRHIACITTTNDIYLITEQNMCFSYKKQIIVVQNGAKQIRVRNIDSDMNQELRVEIPIRNIYMGTDGKTFAIKLSGSKRVDFYRLNTSNDVIDSYCSATIRETDNMFVIHNEIAWSCFIDNNQQNGKFSLISYNLETNSEDSHQIDLLVNADNSVLQIKVIALDINGDSLLAVLSLNTKLFLYIFKIVGLKQVVKSGPMGLSSHKKILFAKINSDGSMVACIDQNLLTVIFDNQIIKQNIDVNPEDEIDVPTLYFLRTEEIIKQELNELQGLSEETTSILLDFLTTKTIDLNHIIKRVNQIGENSHKLWNNLAKLSVKSRDINMGLYCVSRLQNARIVRDVKQELSESGSDIACALLAMNLGLHSEAEEILKSSDNPLKLSKYYQNRNEWQKAIKCVDRVNQKTVYYNYAKHLEHNESNIREAIKYYEMSGTHVFEVPRMLFDIDNTGGSLLKDYCLNENANSNDKESAYLVKWWGQLQNARIVRDVKQELSESGSDIACALLAMNLGLHSEAEEILKSSDNPLKLSKYYQNRNEWQKAIKCVDRVNQKTVYYNYAKHLEHNESNIREAIKYYEMSGTHVFEVPRMLFDIDNTGGSLLKDYCLNENANSNDKESAYLVKWWGQYCESQGDISHALSAYEKAKDYYNLVRLLCYTGESERAKSLLNSLTSEAKSDETNPGLESAQLHLGKHLESINPIESINYYLPSGAIKHAIRVCKENHFINELVKLTITYGTQEEAKDIANTYIENNNYINEISDEYIVQIYYKCGYIGRAIEAALKTRTWTQLRDLLLDQMSDQKVESDQRDLKIDESIIDLALDALKTDSDIIDIVIDLLLLLESNRTPLMEQLIRDHNIEVNEKLVDKVERVTKSKDQKQSLMLALADMALQQGNCLVAAKLYSNQGLRTNAIKALIRTGQTDKVISYANIARDKSVYKIAANYLKTMDFSDQTVIDNFLKKAGTQANKRETE